MKIQITFTAKVTMSREMEMAQADFDSWEEKYDRANGRYRRRLDEELFELTGLTLNDADMDDPELDTFEPVKSPSLGKSEQ